MNVLERGALSSTYQDYDLKNTSTLDERALVSLDWRQSNDMDTMPALETNDDSFLDPQSFIESYTIAWICALQEEFQAACQMLDVDDFETPKGMEASTNDRNVYVFGQLGSHYVVVGCLPKGRTGTINAANVANDMIRTFPNLKFALMVGIGGGAPTKKKDIRLGDVVVSAPSGDHGGVVQLDFGTRLSNGIFKRKGHLNSPPNALLTTTQNVQRLLDNLAKPDMLAEHIKRMNHMPDYSRPQRDRLYRAKFLHRDVDHAQTNTNNLDDDNEDYSNDEDEDGCRYCGEVELVRRKDRKSSREVTVHYGTIASDNVVMRDAEARNKHAMDKDLNVLCFETEAAGLMNNLQCLVIRGICDYADSHKNDEWHKYAALVAAAYARELLLLLKPDRVACMPAWTETKQRE
jgi:nucleoside phosphorylase